MKADHVKVGQAVHFNVGRGTFAGKITRVMAGGKVVVTATVQGRKKKYERLPSALW